MGAAERFTLGAGKPVPASVRVQLAAVTSGDDPHCGRARMTTPLANCGGRGADVSASATLEAARIQQTEPPAKGVAAQVVARLVAQTPVAADRDLKRTSGRIRGNAGNAHSQSQKQVIESLPGTGRIPSVGLVVAAASRPPTARPAIWPQRPDRVGAAGLRPGHGDLHRPRLRVGHLPTSVAHVPRISGEPTGLVPQCGRRLAVGPTA
jgi:hypothetical protein